MLHIWKNIPDFKETEQSSECMSETSCDGGSNNNENDGHVENGVLRRRPIGEFIIIIVPGYTHTFIVAFLWCLRCY